ncbi:MAG: hypothetical protein ACK5PF_03945 [bacterium]|jgi:hypothetical protein
MKLIRIFFFAWLIFLALTTSAQPAGGEKIKMVEGQISELRLVSGPLSLRVVISGLPKMCGNEYDYAYLDESDQNYAAIVQALLSAQARKARVAVFSRQDSSRYCKIEMVTLK